MTCTRTFLIFGLVFTIIAQATPDCNSPQNTPEMRDCAGLDLKKADDELNAVYGKLLKTLDPEGQRRLKESQRAWIKFRDSDAEFRADLNRGGTMEPLARTTTKTELTAQRAKELKSELELRE
jgi:uncharacterized protein YecT (DUF1311 family)